MTSSEEKLEAKLKKIKAEDIMSKYAITTSEDATIDSVAHLMMRFKISGIPVLSKKKEIVGIITATDLFQLMEKVTDEMEKGVGSTDHGAQSVKSLMTRGVVSIDPGKSLYEIIRIMSEKKIHTLPVVVIFNGEIRGVIGRRDVINAFYVLTNSKLRSN